MKKLLISLILIIFSSFSFGNSEVATLKVTKVKKDKSGLRQISFLLTNKSDRQINFLSMSCSHSEFFIVENPDVKIIGENCDKNFPVIIKLKPGESYKKTISISLKNQFETVTAFAFKLTETGDIIGLNSENKSTHKVVKIWTEKIEL